MELDLENRNVLVTGSSRNIGQSIAEAVAEEGANVGITARTNRDGCEETARFVDNAGGRAAIAMCDLSDPDDIEDMVGTIRDELGPIDVLVNNATVRPDTPFLEVDVEELDYAQDVNIRGMFLTTQHVVPDMLESGNGSIINLLGTMVYMGMPGHTHSFATKMGIEGFVRQLATELGPDGIRVNGVSPGLIDTERDQSEDWDRIKRKVTRATPLERQGTIREVADVCCFLASDRASFVTGQIIHVNGGLYPTPNILAGE